MRPTSYVPCTKLVAWSARGFQIRNVHWLQALKNLQHPQQAYLNGFSNIPFGIVRPYWSNFQRPLGLIRFPDGPSDEEALGVARSPCSPGIFERPLRYAAGHASRIVLSTSYLSRTMTWWRVRRRGTVGLGSTARSFAIWYSSFALLDSIWSYLFWSLPSTKSPVWILSLPRMYTSRRKRLLVTGDM